MSIKNSMFITVKNNDKYLDDIVFLIDMDYFLKFAEICNHFEVIHRCEQSECESETMLWEKRKEKSEAFLNSVDIKPQLLPGSDITFYTLSFCGVYKPMLITDIVKSLKERDKSDLYYFPEDKIKMINVKDIEHIKYYGSKIGHYEGK